MKHIPMIIMAISTEQSTPSSYAFLKRPCLRWKNRDCGIQKGSRCQDCQEFSPKIERCAWIEQLTCLLKCNRTIAFILSTQKASARAVRTKRRGAKNHAMCLTLEGTTHNDRLDFNLSSTHCWMDDGVEREGLTRCVLPSRPASLNVLTIRSAQPLIGIDISSLSYLCVCT